MNTIEMAESLREDSAETLAQRRMRLLAAHAAANTAAQDKTPKSAEELVARAGDLAALPQVVLQVIELTGNPNASANELERVIGNDQALTARLLTLANSSYYGLPRRISSLREAIVFLGFKSVRNLAMTITSFNLFLGKSDADSLARRDLWKHSLGASMCARLIASALPNSGVSEQIFTAALLHDIGKMLLIQHLPRPYAEAVATARNENVPYWYAEKNILPFTHTEVGELLASRWNLPEVLVEAIGKHHTPEAVTADAKSVAVVALASDMTNLYGGSSYAAGTRAEPAPTPSSTADLSDLTQPSSAPEASLVTPSALELLQINPETLQRIAAACAAELQSGSSLATMF